MSWLNLYFHKQIYLFTRDMKESINIRTPHSFSMLNYFLFNAVLVMPTLKGLLSTPLGPQILS